MEMIPLTVTGVKSWVPKLIPSTHAAVPADMHER